MMSVVKIAISTTLRIRRITASSQILDQQWAIRNFTQSSVAFLKIGMFLASNLRQANVLEYMGVGM